MIRSTNSRHYEQPARETARKHKRWYTQPLRDRARLAMKHQDWAVLVKLDGYYRALTGVLTALYGYRR